MKHERDTGDIIKNARRCVALSVMDDERRSSRDYRPKRKKYVSRAEQQKLRDLGLA